MDSATLDATFAALADPTRRAILSRLMRGDASVSQLAEPIRMSLPGILKHLHVLEHAGLVELKKQGRSRRCRLNAHPIREVADWISVYRNFWGKNLDSLAQYTENAEAAEKIRRDRKTRRPH